MGEKLLINEMSGEWGLAATQSISELGDMGVTLPISLAAPLIVVPWPAPKVISTDPLRLTCTDVAPPAACIAAAGALSPLRLWLSNAEAWGKHTII